MRFLGRFLDDGRLGPVSAVVIFVVAPLSVSLLPKRHFDELVFFTSTSVHTHQTLCNKPRHSCDHLDVWHMRVLHKLARTIRSDSVNTGRLGVTRVS